MAICPNCEQTVDRPGAPCPEGDGYHGIEEDEYYSYRDDEVLGREIGERYIVQSVLGRGSMSRVYRAYQGSVDRDIALKVFRPATILGRNRGYRTTEQERRTAEEHFVREAKVLGRLSHPNCVTVYDFGSEDDGNLLYMAMEYVAGTSLRSAIRRGLRFEAIAELGRQILEAMREAHSMDIVHRDLKPENVLLSFRYSSDEQVVKVLDFGIAKLLRSEGDEPGSENRLYGTPAYMAPEQCRGEVEAVGPPADIYAFGCVFYELICGTLPYASDNPREMVRLHLQAEIPPVHPRQGLEVPDGIAEFVQRCLQKAPEERYASAHEALLALQEALVGSEVSVGEGLSFGSERSAGRSSSEPPGRRQVSVPENRIRGEQLDPVGQDNGGGESSESSVREDVSESVSRGPNGEPRESSSVVGESRTAGQTAIGVHPEARGDAEGSRRGARRWLSNAAVEKLAIVAAVLAAMGACALVLFYLYRTMTGG